MQLLHHNQAQLHGEEQNPHGDNYGHHACSYEYDWKIGVSQRKGKKKVGIALVQKNNIVLIFHKTLQNGSNTHKKNKN